MEWQVHGEEFIYQSDWVNLSLVDVERPDGSRVPHHVIRAAGPAAGTVVDRGDAVLLIHRHRFTTDTWGWEVPAGRGGRRRNTDRSRGPRNARGDRLAARAPRPAVPVSPDQRHLRPDLPPVPRHRRHPRRRAHRAERGRPHRVGALGRGPAPARRPARSSTAWPSPASPSCSPASPPAPEPRCHDQRPAPTAGWRITLRQRNTTTHAQRRQPPGAPGCASATPQPTPAATPPTHAWSRPTQHATQHATHHRSPAVTPAGADPRTGRSRPASRAGH